MNQVIFVLLLVSALSCRNSPLKHQQKITADPPVYDAATTTGPGPGISLSAKAFLKNKNFSQQYCFLVDMSVSSGKKRFYAYDLAGDSVYLAGLVAHGSCNSTGLAEPKYSNQNGSGCTSLGKYKIGYKYNGRFGPAYKLHGLDSSNSNAFERAVVLHRYECVPDYELMEASICNSLGCPMVSPKFFEQLQTIIDHSKKPILLWMYEGTPTTSAYVLHQ